MCILHMPARKRWSEHPLVQHSDRSYRDVDDNFVELFTTSHPRASRAESANPGRPITKGRRMSELGHIRRSKEQAAAGNRASRRRSRTRRGIATTAVAGAMVATLTAPQAFAADSYQAVTDQILAQQQQIIATNSNYPFIKPSDVSSLPQYTQALAMGVLFGALNEQNRINGYDRNGEFLTAPWNAPSAEPLPFSNDPTADNKYTLLAVRGESYTVTITPRPGTKVVTFVPMSGNIMDGKFISTGVSYDLTQFTPNADGTYTVVISPDQQPGNWVNSTGAQTILMRDTTTDWGIPHDTILIKQQSSSSQFKLPVLSETQVAAVLAGVANNVSGFNSSVTNQGIQAVWAAVPENTFTVIKPTTSAVGGPILPGQLTSIGHFNLQPDQALVVKVPTVSAGYVAAQLTNIWQLDLPYATAQSSLNGSNIFQADDGYTYYVVSATNPGVANWLDNGGVVNGSVTLRFQDVNGTLDNNAVTAEVVPISDIRQHLPADTPTVTPQQYAASLKKRMFEFNYVHNQNNVPTGWATANLELDQIKAAVGTDKFNEIFGSQSNVPSVLDRITQSALNPDYVDLARGIFANPAGSLSAVVQNIPLAVQDIVNPMVLSALRCDLLINQTLTQIRAGLASGNITAVVAALGNGVRGLGTIINQTLTDPGTSVTAGFLNARDDLSVALNRADSYSPLTMGNIKTVVKELGDLGRTTGHMLVGGLRGAIPAANPTSQAPAGAQAPTGTPAPTAAKLAADVTPVKATPEVEKARAAQPASPAAPTAADPAGTPASSPAKPSDTPAAEGSAKPAVTNGKNQQTDGTQHVKQPKYGKRSKPANGKPSKVAKGSSTSGATHTSGPEDSKPAQSKQHTESKNSASAGGGGKTAGAGSGTTK